MMKTNPGTYSILPGEVVRLELPGFSGPLYDNMLYEASSGERKVHVLVSWFTFNGRSPRLDISPKITLAAHQPFEMKIYPVNLWPGISLPSFGTYLNQQDLTISSDAHDGPMLHYPLPVTSANRINNRNIVSAYDIKISRYTEPLLHNPRHTKI